MTQTNNMMTASYLESATSKLLNKAMTGWFADKLIANLANRPDTRLNVIHANLTGLPPVTIINAEIDPLRCDGELLGVNTGVTQEFFVPPRSLNQPKTHRHLLAQIKTAFK